MSKSTSATLAHGSFIPTLLNRRVFIRYPCGLDTVTTLSRPGQDYQPIHVYDLSMGGIGLLLSDPLELGSEVYLRLTNSLYQRAYEVGARVVHARGMGLDQWLVGCQFQRELTLEELATLV